MTSPLVAVYTDNPRLTSELTTGLQGRFRLLLGESLQETTELVRAHRPHALLMDLTLVQGSGIVEANTLRELAEADGPKTVALMVNRTCPPALSALATDFAWTLLPDGFHSDWLTPLEQPAEAVTSTGPQTASASAGEEPSASASADRSATTSTALELPSIVIRREDSEESETVLAGITRRFETNSPALKAMLEDLETAARHNVTILLIGETGSGKTFLSKLIHEVSPRRQEPFLHVACGALPNELIESELFGHVKGSFTSAHADKEGKFVAAGRGTVLLDEIDVLGLEQQVKLLKVIETGEFEPVGSNQTLTSQARLVVASNLDLQPLVEQHKFRPDLYYRLNMLKFELPPLRDRKADVMPLAKKFIQQQTKRHGVEIHRIERNLFDALYNYPWPGNVRELENVIQRAVIFSREGVLTADHLPSHIVSGYAGPTNDPSVQLGGKPRSNEPDSLGDQIALTEKEIIEQALFNNSFSRTKTARELGISRVTLYNKMKKYGMMK